MGSKLLIVAASRRRTFEPKPIPAIDRFQGVYFRIIKKHIREGYLKNTDILILTETLGLVKPQQQIPFIDASIGQSGTLNLTPEQIAEWNGRNLRFLVNFTKGKKYEEVYVNVGRNYIKLITGLERLLGGKITYARGAGLGPKAAHMKNWILGIGS